jgi:hypothetical protein
MTSWRPKGGFSPTYGQRLVGLRPASLLAYWPLNEAAGAVAYDGSGHGYNGAYTSVTLGQQGMGDGNTCPLFDGAASYVSLYTASLAAAFSAAAGAFSLWAKPSAAAIWSNATTYYLMTLGADNNDRLLIVKGGAGTVQGYYIAGATVKATTPATAISGAGWVHLALTWSKAGDAAILYLNGANPQSINGLGTYAGALAGINSLLGAATSVPANVWSGWIAHAALWSATLTPTEIAALAKLN